VTSVNAAFGNCSQTARSSAVTVSHPNLNMYRPGSVTRPTCAQVTLLTANHFPFAPSAPSLPPVSRRAKTNFHLNAKKVALHPTRCLAGRAVLSCENGPLHIRRAARKVRGILSTRSHPIGGRQAELFAKMG
jgi:hypothetical protein